MSATEKNACEQVMPITANTIQLMIAEKDTVAGSAVGALDNSSRLRFLDSKCIDTDSGSGCH